MRSSDAYLVGTDVLGAAPAASGEPDLYDEAASTFGRVEEGVRQVNRRVSPWLWIFSVCGFGMAVLNRVQIAEAVGGSVFGSFDGLRTAFRKRRLDPVR